MGEQGGVGQRGLDRRETSYRRQLEAAAKEACGLRGHSIGHVALQAASLMAVKAGSYYDHREAPAVLRALLKVAGAA